LLPALGNVLIGRLLKGATPNEGTARLAAAMRWTPPGMAAHAIGDAAAGRWLAVAGELALVAVCVGLLVACWLRGLGRITVTHDASSSTVRDGRGLLLRLGNRGRAGAVAARDLRYQWRDPRRRVLWVQVVVLMVFVLGPAARSSGGLMVAGMAFVATVLSMQAAQQFGYDGAAYWMHVSATRSLADVRSDLLGKAIASSAVTLPLLVAGTVVGALVTGRTGLLAIAVVVEVSAFGLGLAASTLLSVWFPVPLPDTSRNVFGSVDPGRGCLAGLAGLGMVVATLATVLAASYPLVRFAHGALAVALCVGLLGLAAAAGVGARAVTARIAFGRLPELLAAVTPRGG
ncbi:MAG: type transport system permease protein, partial [Frankiaceae bacterium]|nr:type transport system permease protein [Frankiaceae bacterium]